MNEATIKQVFDEYVGNETGCKYKDIFELKAYCDMIGIKSILIPWFEGYAIIFNNNKDCVQNTGTYGKLQFYIKDENIDFKSITLEKAKEIVQRYKNELSL